MSKLQLVELRNVRVRRFFNGSRDKTALGLRHFAVGKWLSDGKLFYHRQDHLDASLRFQDCKVRAWQFEMGVLIWKIEKVCCPAVFDVNEIETMVENSPGHLTRNNPNIFCCNASENI